MEWDKRYGKLERDCSTGTDWFRYCQQIGIPKIIPFARELKLFGEEFYQEDGARTLIEIGSRPRSMVFEIAIGSVIVAVAMAYESDIKLRYHSIWIKWQ
jgi:hypothetical protein